MPAGKPRKIKERTIDNPQDRIGEMLNEFSAHECSHDFEHDGFAAC
jgi:hypothetical protein